MAADDAAGTAESAVAAEPKPTETLSQFVARVLDQLSLSAWLPSAALVLLLDFIAELGAQLDAKRQGPAAAVGNTNAKLSGVGIGGAILLVVAVVVLTMLTQAFSFQAIQVLEGYWGVSKTAEWLAHRRCDRHRRRRERLNDRRKELTEAAWKATETKLADDQAKRGEHGQPVQLTPNMLSVLARGSWRSPSQSTSPGRKTRSSGPSKAAGNFTRPQIRCAAAPTLTGASQITRLIS